MTRGRQRRTKRPAPQGTWLAFLALAVQILLPFLVAYEIALASTPARAEGTTVICEAAPTSHQSDHAAHHCAPDHPCPICLACAAAQAFTAAPPVALPLPRGGPVILSADTPVTPTVQSFAAPYQSRAPPAIG